MQMINEDEYWEHLRERMEAPRENAEDEMPEYEEDLLDIDETAEELEKIYGPLEEISEDDILDIVKNETGIDAVSARFDRRLFCIFYKFEAA